MCIRDRNQAEIEKAMKAAVGQEASFAGGPMPMPASQAIKAVSYTHLRAHETVLDLVCRLLLEKKKQQLRYKINN